MFDFETRRDRLRKRLRREGFGSILVTNPVNVTYLTGFTGEDSYLFVHDDDCILLSDGRFEVQLKEECRGLETYIRPLGKNIQQAAQHVLQTHGGQVAFEADSLSVADWESISDGLRGVELAGTRGLVEELRQIKDREEIAALRLAIRHAERGFEALRASLRPEMTEIEAAHFLEAAMRSFGAEGFSFPPIVAGGPRAALPHAQPTRQSIGETSFLLVDWGARSPLYRSDLTRVLATDRIPPKLKRIYGVVFEAQARAIDAIRPGVTCDEIDALARKVIAKAGFGKQFNHGLGHGLGMDIHEAPRLARQSAQILRSGMVVTVEPGIYIPGWGGVRIEDDILVTRSGHEVLTRLSRNWDDAVVDW